MNGEEQDFFKKTLSPTDVDASLVKYFDELANKKGFVPTHRGDQKSRLKAVTKKLVQTNENETYSMRNKSNLYKKNSSQTIPGKLVTKKQMNSTDEAADAYNNIAKLMWPARKNVPTFFSSKRRFYKKLLNRLTKVGKIRRAVKQ